MVGLQARGPVKAKVEKDASGGIESGYGPKKQEKPELHAEHALHGPLSATLQHAHSQTE